MPNKKQQNSTLVEPDELENYFRNTIIAQLFIDADYILRKCTPSAMKMFNLFKEDIGQSINHIIENNFFCIENNLFWELTGKIQQVIETNEILEEELQTQDLKWYRMNIIPYNGVIITFIEISKGIRILQEHEKKFTENKILLDTISHDIKTPLAKLVLSIELLKNLEQDSTEFQPLINIIERSIKQMQNIIVDTTKTMQMQYEDRDENEWLNFEDILNDACFILNDSIKESGAVITHDFEVNKIMFSRKKLRSIIYNLVSNAIKYRSPERILEIMISSKQDKGFIMLSMKDNGMGIEVSKQNKIFDKYFRVQKDIEGTGVGLFLIKEIVKDFGGSISFESELGKGSEFKVSLKNLVKEICNKRGGGGGKRRYFIRKRIRKRA